MKEYVRELDPDYGPKRTDTFLIDFKIAAGI